MATSWAAESEAQREEEAQELRLQEGSVSADINLALVTGDEALSTRETTGTVEVEEDRDKVVEEALASVTLEVRTHFTITHKPFTHFLLQEGEDELVEDQLELQEEPVETGGQELAPGGTPRPVVPAPGSRPAEVQSQDLGCPDQGSAVGEPEWQARLSEVSDELSQIQISILIIEDKMEICTDRLRLTKLRKVELQKEMLALEQEEHRAMVAMGDLEADKRVLEERRVSRVTLSAGLMNRATDKTKVEPKYACRDVRRKLPAAEARELEARKADERAKNMARVQEEALRAQEVRDSEERERKNRLEVTKELARKKAEEDKARADRASWADRTKPVCAARSVTSRAGPETGGMPRARPLIKTSRVPTPKNQADYK